MVKINSEYISRFFNRIYTAIITPIIEKKYVGNGTRLKYLFFPSVKSKVMVVGFQACAKEGARYNYVRTLNDFKVNKLYIKDDFASNRRGNYYLGSNGKYNVEKATYELIDKYIEKLKPDKIVFIGSSKGGYAALNFGVSYINSSMIVAAPQYYLGMYLNNVYQMPNLIDILGDVTEENIFELDARLKNKVLNNNSANTQRVFLHYSNYEHTYNEHIRDLINDMKYTGYKIDFDIHQYAVHGELKYYYPSYLRSSLRKLLEDE